MSVCTCEYMELQKYIGKTIYLIQQNKNLYMGILTGITTQKTKNNILEVTLNFADKRKYSTLHTETQYLVL